MLLEQGGLFAADPHLPLLFSISVIQAASIGLRIWPGIAVNCPISAVQVAVDVNVLVYVEIEELVGDGEDAVIVDVEELLLDPQAWDVPDQ